MNFTPRTFRSSCVAAVRDKRLHAVVDQATRLFQKYRKAAFAEFKDGDTHLARARAVRLAALSRLPDLLEELEKNAAAAGTIVHWAADAAEARGIITGIARKAGAKIIVKGKSMVSEEIGLDPALQKTGAEVWETDLGEFIVQLAGEPPAHIFAPSINKSRWDVAELFRNKLGLEIPDGGESIPGLTMLARRALREKFLAADMGVTGVNVAVAETGSIVLVENEGNIRMSTTCPRVHVALMSLEKVVPTLDDAATILRILPRSAAGQKMASYVSVLTGPRRPGETDGPEEMHLVILDNGRSKVMADPVLREALLCIRCGACLNTCPVYQSVGGLAYGSAYSGPIGTILTSLLWPAEDTRDLPFGCTLCGACKRTCPLKIDHPKLILRLRERVCAGHPPLFGAAHSRLAMHHLAYRLAVDTVRTADPHLKLVSHVPGVARFAEARRPPELKKPFTTRLRRRNRRGKA